MEAFLLSTFLSARRETALLLTVGKANRHETTSVNACEDCGAVMVGYGYRRPMQGGAAAHVISVDSGQ